MFPAPCIFFGAEFFPKDLHLRIRICPTLMLHDQSDVILTHIHPEILFSVSQIPPPPLLIPPSPWLSNLLIAKGQSHYTIQRRFCPMRKNVCFGCIFGCSIQICFQNFSIAHTFRSRLKGWNLLRQDTNVCFYRGRHEDFKDFFSLKDGVVFGIDVCSVMEVLDREYNPDQCRLFIDSSKVSLKLVLLHNGNRLPSVPLAPAANMEDNYGSMKLHLGKVKCDELK